MPLKACGSNVIIPIVFCHLNDMKILSTGERLIAVLAFENVQLLDVAGPVQAFATANALTDGKSPYRIVVVSRRGGAVISSAGLPLVTQPFAGAGAPIDTLIVPGGPGIHDALANPPTLKWVRRQFSSVHRLASVCTGAFMLAEAGVLAGRRATTHWTACARLQESYPSIQVERDPIYVRDGKVWTSAGITAGIDLTLALIEEDLGRKLAMKVARHLVVFLNRPGGQSQFSVPLEAQATAANGNAENHFEPLHGWIAENLTGDLRVERLAAQAGMSARTFARVYAAEIGTTPARMVEKIRVEAVRRLLEQTSMPIKSVASVCGFGKEERLRRAFARQVGTTPAEYRARF